MDRRPPLASASRSRAPEVAPQPITIHIHAAPGMDERSLARAVSVELDRRERAKRSARLSSLHDIN